MLDSTIFKVAVAEDVRLRREQELADAKGTWALEAAQFVSDLNRATFIDGLKDKNPSIYVKSLMNFNIDDINSVLATRTVMRPCVCSLHDLDAKMKELERRNFHAHVVADATHYLFEKFTGRKTFEDVLLAKKEAGATLGELKRFQVYMRHELLIQKFTYGCTLEGSKHVVGLSATHALLMEREELCTKIPYIYSKMMDMLFEKIKVE